MKEASTADGGAEAFRNTPTRSLTLLEPESSTLVSSGVNRSNRTFLDFNGWNEGKVPQCRWLAMA